MRTFFIFGLSFVTGMSGLLLCNVALNKMVDIVNSSSSASQFSQVGWNAFKTMKVFQSYKEVDPRGKYGAMFVTALVLVAVGFTGSAFSLLTLPSAGSR